MHLLCYPPAPVIGIDKSLEYVAHFFFDAIYYCAAKGAYRRTNDAIVFYGYIDLIIRVRLIEGPANLEELKKPRFLFFGFPAKMGGLESFPIRAVAVEGD